MSAKVSITLDDDVLSFVDQRAENRSSFINEILWREKQRIFLKELEEAYIEQSADSEFQEEMAAWDVVIGDGIGSDA
jgi:deoxyribodipyrimidine photolyase